MDAPDETISPESLKWDHAPILYVLDEDRVAVPVASACVELWANWLADRSRSRVADDVIGSARISTVFLGVDHNFGASEPLLFETMVFGGCRDGHTIHTATWAEAEATHRALVAELRAGCAFCGNVELTVGRTCKVCWTGAVRVISAMLGPDFARWQAERASVEVVIDYVGPSGRVAQRRIQPHEIMYEMFSGQTRLGWGLYAFDLDATAYEIFDVCRIMGWKDEVPA